MIDELRDWIVRNKKVVLVLFIALLLRLVAVNQSLWLDEAIGAETVKNFTYRGILTDFLTSDNHPPLYYLDLKSWTEVIGYSELALRLPSVIYGVLTVLLTYLIGKSVFKSRNLALISALLLTTSQLHIYYSQEARMYSLAAFLAAFSIYSYLKVISDSLKKSIYWILFSFSITALVFTDYVPVFLLPVFWIYASNKRKKKNWWKNFITAHAPLLILGLIWLPTFQVQSAKGKWLLATLPEWRKVAGGANFKQAVLFWMKFVLGRISFSPKVIYYLLVGIVSVPIIYSFKKAFKPENKLINLLWLWFLLPPAFGFLASLLFPAFIYFRFIYVLPAFYLLVAVGISNIKSNKLAKLVLGVILAGNLISFLIYAFDSNQQREQWRQATEFVETNIETDEVVLFSYPEPFTPYRWYMGEYANREDIHAWGVTDSVSPSVENTKKTVETLTRNKKGVYYFEYLSDLADPNNIVENSLLVEGFEVGKVYNFNGVGQVFYYTR